LSACTESNAVPRYSATVLPEPRQTIKGWGCFPTYLHKEEVLAEYLKFDSAQDALYRELGGT
jgi:hypothetical protein